MSFSEGINAMLLRIVLIIQALSHRDISSVENDYSAIRFHVSLSLFNPDSATNSFPGESPLV
jgi:hypothetical protein